jgi:hypothetical protein
MIGREKVPDKFATIPPPMPVRFAKGPSLKLPKPKQIRNKTFSRVKPGQGAGNIFVARYSLCQKPVMGILIQLPYHFPFIPRLSAVYLGLSRFTVSKRSLGICWQLFKSI